MKSTNHALTVGLAILIGGVAAGCAAALCQPGEPSVNCCIKKFPLRPVESCAATEAERCIRSYVDCKNQGWMGSCYDCLRYCEGQQEWPFNKCRKSRKASP